MRNTISVRVIGDYVMTIVEAPNGDLMAFVDTARGIASLILAYRQALRIIHNG